MILINSNQYNPYFCHMIYVIVLFFVCVIGCRALLLWVYDVLNGIEPKREEIHHHYHTHQNLTIINEEKKIEDYDKARKNY